MTSRKKETTKVEQKDFEILPIRLPLDIYEELRHLSYETKIPMAQYAREGIEYILKKHKK